MPDEVRPFLTHIASAQPRSLGAALPAIPVAPATSPWSPKAEAPVAAPMPVRDLGAEQAQIAAARAEAIAQGRADGLRELEGQRDRLAALIAELELARTAVQPPAADLIADAATAVVTAWIERGDRKELFAPIVRAWIARCHEAATARVHPGDVDALREAIGDAPITVVGDDAIARGDIRISGGALEVSHAWEPRLRELREAIAAAIDDRK